MHHARPQPATRTVITTPIPIQLRRDITFTSKGPFSGVAIDRHAPQRHARRSVNGVTQCRHGCRCSGLANATRGLTVLKQMHIDLRRLIHPKDSVVVKIGLLNASLLNRDFTIKSGR